jgi:hypothetical protein
MGKAKRKPIDGLPDALETEGPVYAFGVASGHERAAPSPALELQEYLERMISDRTVTPPQQPLAATALALTITSAAVLCSAFWYSLARLVLSMT